MGKKDERTFQDYRIPLPSGLSATLHLPCPMFPEEISALTQQFGAFVQVFQAQALLVAKPVLDVLPVPPQEVSVQRPQLRGRAAPRAAPALRRKPPRKKRIGNREDYRAEILSLKEQGKSAIRISKILKVSTNTVYRCLKDAASKSKRKSPSVRNGVERSVPAIPRATNGAQEAFNAPTVVEAIEPVAKVPQLTKTERILAIVMASPGPIHARDIHKLAGFLDQYGRTNSMCYNMASTGLIHLAGNGSFSARPVTSSSRPSRPVPQGPQLVTDPMLPAAAPLSADEIKKQIGAINEIQVARRQKNEKPIGLLAGGVPDLYRQLRPKVEQQKGISLAHHIDSQHPKITHLPNDVMLLIILADAIRGGQADALAEQARQRGIPVIRSVRKWSKLSSAIDKQWIERLKQGNALLAAAN